MNTKRLEWLRRQRESAASEVEVIANRAADDDRDLSDAEQNTCEARRSRLEQLDNEIELEVEMVERSSRYQQMAERMEPLETREVASSSPVKTLERSSQLIKPEQFWDSPGDYLVGYLMRSKDPHSPQAKRFDEYWRAAAHQTTADNPGIIPTPIVGPVWGTITARRPSLSAATMRPMPSGGTKFTRPHVTQHTAAGLQTAEKSELPSRKMIILPLDVTKATYGGYVNLSFQDRDWTEPAIMNILIDDLAGVYGQETNEAFVTYFVAQVTETQAVASDDAAGWLDAIFSAAATVYGNQNALPNTFWLSPDVWAMLGSLVDLSGRPLFPSVGPQNALGNLDVSTFAGDVAGIRIVVDAALPAGTCILGDSRAVEVFEQVGGTVSAVEPSVLGTQIAYYGYAAWIVIEPGAFVKLTAPAGGATRTQKAEKAEKS